MNTMDERRMNLLVTNTRSPQAYDIIRALRPFAQKIVATMLKESFFPGRQSFAAYSRHVDKRYVTPSPVSDWSAGNVQKENTEREEEYICKLLRICDDEKIDIIYPSLDPYVYVLSKNKERFKKMGVLIPAPDYEILMTVTDKYRTIKAAQKVGFPCPETYLLEYSDDLPWYAERLGFPLVIKPRFTLGGKGMKIVTSLPELLDKAPLVAKQHNVPMLQEYIPGGDRDSFQFLFDRQGDLKFAFHKKRHREFRVTHRLGTVSESRALPPLIRDSEALFKKIGWWGAAGIETKRDPRDNLLKLMEINPRFPRQLWNRMELGINEPLMCLNVLRDEMFETINDYPVGTLFIAPIEDIMLLGVQILDILAYKFRTVVLGKSPQDPLNAPLSLKNQIQSFVRTYVGDKQRVFDPYSKYFFHDPVVSIMWWLQFSTWVLWTGRHLGR
ncbi:ATP-grasp domain-containing protein [Acidobacteriota bacterium]